MAVSLLLALLVAQPSEESIDEFLRPQRAERVRRAGGRSGPGFAFFEFAPSSGAGMGAVAPLPNWLYPSETFDTWSTGAATVAVPTRTANQAANPIDGAVTADRVQIPATLSTQASWIYPGASPLASVLGATSTCSVYVLGNAMSGTLDLCTDNAPVTCSPCSFTSSSWSRCSVTGAPTTAGAFYFGNMSLVAYNGGVARAANDVFAFGAMCNVGSTAAPYIATTTAAKGFTPTGAKGEALTFTRTGTAMATKTATGGLATTGIANGDLVLVPANQPRVEYDSNGTLGLLVESARTNVLLRSQEFNNATWTKYNFGSGSLPVVTADYATAPDGTLTADRVQFSAVNAGDQSAILQASGITTGSNTVSVYVKGTSGSGSICVQAYISGGAYTECSYNSTTWTRCTHTGTVTSSGQMRIGNDASTCNAAASRTAQDVLLWGAQWENASYATSYIPTGAGTATRNAETADFTIPALTLTAPWSVAATVQLPAGLPTNARLHGTIGPSGLATYATDSFASAGTWTADSTQVTPNSYSTGRTVSASGTYRAATYHDGTNFSGCIDNVCGAGAARAWSSLANITVIRLGAYNSTNGVIDGIQSRYCFQTDSATRCR